MASISKTIVVVGSINTDLVVTADRLPLPGETITGKSFATFQGGKGANQAVAAAKLGASVTLIGKVGSDAFGSESLRQLTSQGVNCEHVLTELGDSGLAVISVGSGGRNTIIVIPGANAQVSPAFVESKRHVIREAGIVLAQLEIPLDTVLRLAEICKQEKVPLMLDPAPAAALPEGLLELCHWFTPNETEAAFYAANQDAACTAPQIAISLRAKGARNIVLKRGDQGVYIDCDDSAPIEIPAMKVLAVDTTAAGDTYNGAFATALMNGEELPACARFASASAALSVTRVGAQASMPTLAESTALLKSLTI